MYTPDFTPHRMRHSRRVLLERQASDRDPSSMPQRATMPDFRRSRDRVIMRTIFGALALAASAGALAALPQPQASGT